MAEAPSEILDKLNNFIDRINSAGIRVEKAYLYGSFASGRQKKTSDIDVALVSPNFSEDFVENDVTLAGIRAAVDCRIEPKAFRPEEFVDEHPLVWEIKKHGIPLIH